jgi:hypothetical protein
MRCLKPIRSWIFGKLRRTAVLWRTLREKWTKRSACPPVGFAGRLFDHENRAIAERRKPVLCFAHVTDQMAGFLGDALVQKCGDLFRVIGPQVFRANEWSYMNAPDGEVSRFTGSEEIDKAGQLV